MNISLEKIVYYPKNKTWLLFAFLCYKLCTTINSKIKCLNKQVLLSFFLYIKSDLLNSITKILILDASYWFLYSFIYLFWIMILVWISKKLIFVRKIRKNRVKLSKNQIKKILRWIKQNKWNILVILRSSRLI